MGIVSGEATLPFNVASLVNGGSTWKRKYEQILSFNPTALRMAKTPWSLAILSATGLIAVDPPLKGKQKLLWASVV